MLNARCLDDAITEAAPTRSVGTLPPTLSEHLDEPRWSSVQECTEQEFRSLSNELLGTTLLRALGLPGRPFRRLSQHGERRFALLCLDGERFEHRSFVPPAEQNQLLDLLVGLYVFDVWAAHVGRRELVLVRERQQARLQVFTSSNKWLFYGPVDRPESKRKCVELAPAIFSVVTNPYASTRFSFWVEKMQAVLPVLIEQLVNSSHWQTSKLISEAEEFVKRLSSLASLIALDLEQQHRHGSTEA